MSKYCSDRCEKFMSSNPNGVDISKKYCDECGEKLIVMSAPPPVSTSPPTVTSKSPNLDKYITTTKVKKKDEAKKNLDVDDNQPNLNRNPLPTGSDHVVVLSGTREPCSQLPAQKPPDTSPVRECSVKTPAVIQEKDDNRSEEKGKVEQLKGGKKRKHSKQNDDEIDTDNDEDEVAKTQSTPVYDIPVKKFRSGEEDQPDSHSAAGERAMTRSQTRLAHYGNILGDESDSNKCYIICFTTAILEELYKMTQKVLLCIALPTAKKFQNYFCIDFQENTVSLDNVKFVLLSGNLFVSPKLLTSNFVIKFSYKYALVNSENKEVLEDLHIQNNCNRFFSHHFNSDCLGKEIKYKYDSIILPPTAEKSNYLYSLLSGFFWENTDNIPYANIKERCLISLKLFLPSFLGLGKSEFQICHNIEDFIDHLHSISTQLTSKFLISKHFKDKPSFQIKLSPKTLLESWLNEAFHFPIDCNDEVLYIRICTILYYILKNESILSDLDDNVISFLLSYCEKDFCDNRLDVFLRDPEKSLEEIEKSFSYFIFKKMNSNLNCLRLIPLYHHICHPLYNGLVQLRESNDIHNTRFWGIPDSYHLFDVVVKVENKFLEELLTLSSSDPLLSYSLIMLTLTEDNLFIFLSSKLLPLSTYLAVVLKRFNNFNSNKENQNSLRCEIYKKIMACLNSGNMNVDFNNIIYFTFKLLQNLREGRNLKLNECELIVQLISYELQIKSIPQDLSKLGVCEASELADLVAICLNTVVLRKEEVENWNFFFKLKFPDNYNFNSMLESHLSKIIHELSLSDYLGLFFYCSKDSTNICADILDIIRTNIMNRVMASNDQQREKIIEILRTTKQFPGAKDIFSQILLDERANFKKEPHVHLVKWIGWKSYFEIFVRGNLHEIIQEEAEIFLMIVSEVYTDLLQSILDKSLFVKDVHCCIGRINQFDKILETFSKSNHFKEKRLTIQSIKQSLRECGSSLKQLDIYLTRLQDFKSIPNSFFSKLDFSLPKTMDEMRMGELCGFKDKHFEIYYNSEINLIIRSSNFLPITESIKHLKHSKIFLEIFEHNFKEYIGNEDQFLLINLDHFYCLVWLPTIKMIESFYDSALSFEIALRQVSKYFDKASGVDDIHKSLTMLSEGIQSIESPQKKVRDTSSDDARKCAEAIDRYLNFHDCTQTADLISQIASEYNFIGDFKIVNKLVHLHTKFQDETLNDLTDDIFKVGKSLQEFSPIHRKGLESFLHCHEFIIWVKNNLPNLVDLKMFVNLSTSNCGDNQIVIHSITTFHTVCTSFAPLIYDIGESDGYHKFVKKCEKVNLSIDKNNQLPQMLRQVAERLSLWKELRHSHGSFEKSAIKQLHTLCEIGLFKVTNSDNVISVTTCAEKEGVVTRYNMEQLKDLHSQLNLVIGRNSSALSIDNRESTSEDLVVSSINAVRMFSDFLEKLTILVDTITKLSECGNFKYLKYEFHIKIIENDRIEDEMKQTENDLRIWKKSLEEARNRHYFLNYFTTRQLALLRKGISCFLRGDEKSEDYEQLIHLLSLVNNELRKEDLIESLKSAGIMPDEVSPLKQCHSISTLAFQKIRRAKSNPNTEEGKIPEEFSKNERDLVNNIHGDCGIPIELVVRGAKVLKAEHGTVLEQDLVVWCLDNCSESDEPMEVSVTEKSPKPLSIVALTKQYNSQRLSRGTDISDLHQLGEFLNCLYNLGPSCAIRKERQLPPTMMESKPNLVLVPNCSLFPYVIHLYSHQHNYPFPFYHEVLICNCLTEFEEIEIFWRRALSKSDVNDKCIFCLVSIEKLRYEVAVHSVNLFWNLQHRSETSSSYKLVLICSEESEEQSYMAAAFENFKIHLFYTPNIDLVKAYLLEGFKSYKFCGFSGNNDPAWLVDRDRSKVRLIVSESVGAGKSLYVRNLVSDMSRQGVVSEGERDGASVTVAIHGKQASEEQLTGELLRKHVSCLEHGHLFHVDVNSTVQLGLEPILFKLLVLGGICKGTGEFWHCRAVDYYVLEMTVDALAQPSLANFISLFPKEECIQPYQFDLSKHPQGNKLKELKQEPFQRVALYLSMLHTGGDLDSIEFDFQNSRLFSRRETLEIILKYCVVSKPSWAEVKIFVSFLNKQLKDCENSSFCTLGVMGGDWRGFKSFVVKFMIAMSRDFATPCFISEPEKTRDILERYEISKKRRWEENSHPYIFFNPDKQTMTFLGFHISEAGHLIDPDRPEITIEDNIMSNNLKALLTQNSVQLQENYQNLDRLAKLWKIARVMDLEYLSDPDTGYVLTLDNVRKILAILMRFRCNIPVVIMGETGCGKTRLIQFMCELQALQTGVRNMLILKVHGGTTERSVMDKVEEAQLLAERNSREHNIDTVLFFDEANTSPAIGLIKEIMCDRRMYGRKIRTDIGLQFIAACNPYRKHSVEMLNKLSSAGLGFFTEASRTTDRLGDIPLRELVYRVMELPTSMRPLVWDFGQLSNNIERTYIREIVTKHLRDHDCPIDASGEVVNVITEILSSAQNYMRERKDECSFVSLRDVERAMRVLLWFYKNREYLYPREKIEVINSIPKSSPSQSSVLPSSSKHVTKHRPQPYSPYSISKHRGHTSRSPTRKSPVVTKHHKFVSSLPTESSPVIPQISCPSSSQTCQFSSDLTNSVILSLAVCYRAKLEVRGEFDHFIISKFKYPLFPLNDPREINILIDECQKTVIDSMVIGKHIAKNLALKENIFMMFVCIELKIPLFVIGKPGSSKSLAKTIISNNMLGESCPDNSILKNFKHVQIMSYQCSQLSTADGIIGVFKNCRSLQKSHDSNKFVSCVVLDEVGLAEDSPQLPLKVLHPLLENSIHFAEEHNSEVGGDWECSFESHGSSPEDVVSSVDPENENSRVAFIGISNWALDPAKMNRGIMVSRSDPDIAELVSSAKGILETQNVEETCFHSSLNNYILSLAQAYQQLSLTCPNYPNSRESDSCAASKHYFGLRDFYSLIKMLVFLCNHFRSEITFPILKHAVLRNFGGIVNVNPVDIFNQKLVLPEKTDQVGPNCSPLDLIAANLSNFDRSFHGETRYLLLLTENYAALNILLKSEGMWSENDLSTVSVIFGSSFPKDREYSTVCRNINKIKICMESGKKVVLLNLENLYESLYDVLNQYYMEIFGQRFVDLGLGTHRMKSKVHNDFKLIVIANTETVYAKFPTPLINRLEKHFLTMSTILSDVGKKLSSQLADWARSFSTIVNKPSIGFKNHCYSEGDCFVGYHEDTSCSIVFQIIKEMYPLVKDIDIDKFLDRDAVFERSLMILLRMATTDAVLRLKGSLLAHQSEIILKEYFKFQLGSLEEYLRQALEMICGNKMAHLTLATTYSRLLTDRDVNELTQRLYQQVDHIKCLNLQQFQTEQQFSKEIQKFLMLESSTIGSRRSGKIVLLVQCDKGADNSKLIACTRYKVIEELKEWQEMNHNGYQVYFIFLVQLKREAHGSQFVSFCGGDWNTIYIDDICPLDYQELPPIPMLFGCQIHQLFAGFQEDEMESDDAILISNCQRLRLKDCIQSAIARLDDINGSEVRTFVRMHQFLELLENQDTNGRFFKTLCWRLATLLQERIEHSIDYNGTTDWLQQIACSGQDIQSSSTFRKAVILHINKVITPLISEVIACLDRNGNLELCMNGNGEILVDPNLYELWHKIFGDEKILLLKYQDFLSYETFLPRPRVPVLSDGSGKIFFQAQFPFSWLIYQRVDELNQESKRLQDNFSATVLDHTESLFKNSDVGNMIDRIFDLNDERDNNQLILSYLHDFIYMTLYPANSNQFNVLQYVILRCSENIKTIESDGFFDTPNSSNTLSIPRIHYAFTESKQLLELLKRAFTLDDSLGVRLLSRISKLDEDNNVRPDLELMLLEEIILLTDLSKEHIASQEQLESFETNVVKWQPVVQEAISFSRPDKSYESLCFSLCCQWNRIFALMLYSTNCSSYIRMKNISHNLNTLSKILGDSPDFADAQTIKRIIHFLSNSINVLIRNHEQESFLEKYRKNATRFFLNVLTSLTFKSMHPDEANPELVEILTSLITLDKDALQTLYTTEGRIILFKDTVLDPSPAFRSYLFQILMKHRNDLLRETITVYIEDGLTDVEIQIKSDLFLLVVQSIEDSLHLKFHRKNIQDQCEYLLTLSQLPNFPSNFPTNISYGLLECISQLRFLCIHISSWIVEHHQLLPQLQSGVSELRKDKICKIIDSFQGLCLTNEYLHVLLLKDIYHKLGSDTIRLLSSNVDLSWIIPEWLSQQLTEDVLQIPDFFVIYPDYIPAKRVVEQVLVSYDYRPLIQLKDDLKSQQCILFAVFQLLLQSKVSSHKVNEEGLTALKKFFETCLDNDLEKSLALKIISNSLGNDQLNVLNITAELTNAELCIVRLIFHTAVMLTGKKFPKLFAPISLLYTDPGALKDRLFPTMMDDNLVSAKAALKKTDGAWYTCPEGHPYLIGDCTQPYHTGVCLECGKQIGGNQGILHRSNELLTSHKDGTKPGYTLGKAAKRETIPSGERSLSPSSVMIIRALMHITFIWSSLSNSSSKKTLLVSLVNGGLDGREELTLFFYENVGKDIDDLAKLTGKNFEEASFIIHLIIKSLIQAGPNNRCKIPIELVNRDLRRQWEVEFEKLHIRPILSSLNTTVDEAMELVLDENRISNNPLLRTIYERDRPESDNVLPHLWRYRTLVNLQHFSQSFSTADPTVVKKCPLINKLLKEERKLFVTQFLPDIVKLQNLMRGKFLYRIDRYQAKNIKIMDFITDLKRENPQEAQEYQRLIDSVQTAWDLIGDDVRQNGRLTLDTSMNLDTTSSNTPLIYLFPSPVREGLFITSLLDYLVVVHNSFVHAYRDKVRRTFGEKIPLRNMTSSHLINYQDQLHSLLFSNAHYSLRLGQGAQVTYDFEAVEKQFVEQFILHKPIIIGENFYFEFKRDACKASVFEKVRLKVNQIDLKEALWNVIKEDLDSLQTLSSVLDMLDIVIGFLASAGGNAEQKISSYVYDVLKYTTTSSGLGPLRSRKAEGVLCLKHVLSFWRFVSIEKARQFSLQGHIPFYSLREEFRESISEEEGRQIENSCYQFPVENVLAQLHDFIIFFVDEIDIKQSEYGLRESFEAYTCEKDAIVPDTFYLHFPERIKLSQTAAAWAVLAQKSHKINNPICI